MIIKKFSLILQDEEEEIKLEINVLRKVYFYIFVLLLILKYLGNFPLVCD